MQELNKNSVKITNTKGVNNRLSNGKEIHNTENGMAGEDNSYPNSRKSIDNKINQHNWYF